MTAEVHDNSTGQVVENFRIFRPHRLKYASYQAARGEHPVRHCKIEEMVGPEGLEPPTKRL